MKKTKRLTKREAAANKLEQRIQAMQNQAAGPKRVAVTHSLAADERAARLRNGAANLLRPPRWR